MEQLKDQPWDGKVSTEDFREAINSLDEARRKLQHLLEWATDQKQDVFYGILRMFVSLKRETRFTLVEASQPVYREEVFEVFLFSFVNGVLARAVCRCLNRAKTKREFS